MDTYIESTGDGNGNQYWPIVRRVRILMPNCKVLSTGAKLVDLPGVRDSNAARNKVASEVSHTDSYLTLKFLVCREQCAHGPISIHLSLFKNLLY